MVQRLLLRRTVLVVGNKRFRDLVAEGVDAYNNANSRLSKANVVNSIVEEIRATGGRFLRRDEATGGWQCKSMIIIGTLNCTVGGFSGMMACLLGEVNIQLHTVMTAACYAM